MNLDGSGRRPLTACEKDVEGYKFSPDGKQVILVHSVDTYTSIEKKYDDLPLASGMVITDLNYKHWDRYVTDIPHIFLASRNADGTIGASRDILNGEPFECPVLPFGGSEQFNWSPDGRQIVYTSRKKTGRDYAVSTDTDIYCYDTATGTTKNLCKPEGYTEPDIDPSLSLEHQPVNRQTTDCNTGYDTNPDYSPNGRYVAWLSMARNGYESDRQPPLHIGYGNRREDLRDGKFRVRCRRFLLGCRQSHALLLRGMACPCHDVLHEPERRSAPTYRR